MMKRIVLAALMLIVVLVVALPTFAQDATEAVTPAPAAGPAPCSADELKQVLAQVSQMGDKISAASKATSSAQTAESLTAGLTAWGDAYQTYFTGVYTGYPQCIDGVLMSDTLGFVLNQEMTLTAGGLLVVVNTDPDINKAVNDMAAIQAKVATQATSSFTSYGKQIAGGQGLPAWFPACTPDQIKEASVLDGYEKTWADQAPALQAIVDDGTFDKASYITLAKLITDFDTSLSSSSGFGSCGELYRRVSNDLYIFGDSFTAMSIAGASASVSDNADFTKLQTYFTSVIQGYLTTVLVTPEATDEL